MLHVVMYISSRHAYSCSYCHHFSLSSRSLARGWWYRCSSQNQHQQASSEDGAVVVRWPCEAFVCSGIGQYYSACLYNICSSGRRFIRSWRDFFQGRNAYSQQCLEREWLLRCIAPVVWVISVFVRTRFTLVCARVFEPFFNRNSDIDGANGARTGCSCERSNRRPTCIQHGYVREPSWQGQKLRVSICYPNI